MRILRSCILFISVLFVAVNLFVNETAVAQGNNGWTPLAQKYSLQDLSSLIIPRDQWHPYPTVQDPAGFGNVPEDVKQEYIKEAESLLNARWPRLPATTFLQFKRTGNRSNYQKLSFQRRQMLAKLVLAEAFERKGRFVDQIINGIWAICEESFWGVPAHLSLQKAGPGLPDVEDPVVDLFAAETAQEMAWTYYLLKPELDSVNPLIAKRIEYETQRRIFTPYLEHNDWGYLGFEWRSNPQKYSRVNNWNPWINSNVLPVALVLAKDSDMRLKLVYKTMDSIDNFVIPYPADGGSDEGPGYWGRAAASLLDYLEILKSASGGKIDYFNQPVIKKMGEYIYKTNISYPYYVNYGDTSAKIEMDPALLYRFGETAHDSTLIHFAAFEYRKQMRNGLSAVLNYPFGALNRSLPALMCLADLREIKPEEPLIRDSWFPDIQIMTARSKRGTSDGFYVMAKAGNNGASHNHNDIGNYIVFYNGNPLLIDAGSQDYTAKTFSSRRYELWNNQSRYHNLPDINGIMQHNGEQFKATGISYTENDRRATLTLNIARAYPDSAFVDKWIRTITLNRGKNVEVSEDYSLGKFIKPVAENFLTPCKPDISVTGKITLSDPENGQTCYVGYDSHKFTPSVDIISINDHHMKSNWGSTLYHIVLHSLNHSLHDRFILKITR